MRSYTPLLSFFLLFLLFSSVASANVTLIFTEPLLKGNTEMKLFTANDSVFVGTITTNGSEVILVDGQAYILQVMPTGVNFLNDPAAGFDYLQSSLPVVFIVAVVFSMAVGLVGLVGYVIWKKGKS